MKKRIKYYVCLLAILVAGTSLSRASSGSDMSITAASAIESLHAKSLHIAYATGILAMPSAVFLHAATAPALSSAIVTGERDLLFAPPPPPDTGTGGGGAVGEAPIRDCVWLLVLISLAYMFLAPGFVVGAGLAPALLALLGLTRVRAGHALPLHRRKFTSLGK